MSKVIEKKILPQYIYAVINGEKTFELRKDDDGIEVGDHVILREWTGENYTGLSIEVEVTYVLRNVEQYGLMNGYCIFGIRKVGKRATRAV